MTGLRVLANQKTIMKIRPGFSATRRLLAHQRKLDALPAGQKTTKANQARILANQARILRGR